MENRLAQASSAYLRSAAHQPIHWYSWGPEAFARAAAEDRPVLLDIGAVWCHWCHVMDGESYEDPALAAFLNEHFVCIKVDRDERPDVDTRYQRAVAAMTNQGGWPLTAFLRPDGQVFYGGTYFPPDGKYGRPGFRTVLEQVLKVWRTQRERVGQQAAAIQRVIAEQLDEALPGDAEPTVLATATERMAALFDFQNGGFGSQPKFPHPAAVLFLLTRWHDTKDSALAELVQRTLDGMARGGIHDQLAGGFHRYSVDARWIVPHFEKMSYDNAELLRAYAEGYAALGGERWREVALGIIRWVREVLADPEGGYAASQDADVGLEDDGDYFTWTLEEATEVIGDAESLAVTAAYYDIGTAGEMHHHPARNVLFVAERLESIAGRLGLPLERVTDLLRTGEERLRAARAHRPEPFVDRTRYTNWNGMLAGALIRSGALLGDGWAVEHGLRSLERIRREHAGASALRHSPGGIEGLLDDQVQVALAAIEAYEVTADGAWLAWSEALLDRVWQDYLDAGSGGLFDTASSAGEGLLPTRARPVQDTPTPSPNGVAALAAARLAALTQAPRWGERLATLVRAFAGGAPELGIYGATFLQAVDWQLSPATHFVVTGGGAADPLARALHEAALTRYAPRRVVQRVEAGGAALPAPVAPMAAAGGGTRAFACSGMRCLAPATSLEEWRARLDEITGR
ncbi:MAG: thioredoxin domain-containing protein [Gemmatimonadales bacterium]